mmetsp:Transcript_78278/g.123587  ORF Transcript_78278/g.123587 Transcript_78278/m.123587 type:complete len:87 (-) Transcript_78278:1178-1438(-)
MGDTERCCKGDGERGGKGELERFGNGELGRAIDATPEFLARAGPTETRAVPPDRSGEETARDGAGGVLDRSGASAPEVPTFGTKLP